MSYVHYQPWLAVNLDREWDIENVILKNSDFDYQRK